MKNRITKQVIVSREEMENSISIIRERTIVRNTLAAAREAEIKAIDESYREDFTRIDADLAAAVAVAERWAEQNPAEFAKTRSIATIHGVLGYRTGTPALKTIAGWTWDRVLEKLRSLRNLAHYIRTKDEVDKQAILADRDGIGPDMLKVIGVKVVQAESFFVEPAISASENRQTKAA